MLIICTVGKGVDTIVNKCLAYKLLYQGMLTFFNNPYTHVTSAKTRFLFSSEKRQERHGGSKKARSTTLSLNRSYFGST